MPYSFPPAIGLLDGETRLKKENPTNESCARRSGSKKGVGRGLVEEVHFVSRDVLEGRKVRHKILYVGVYGPGTVDAVVLEEFDRGVDVRCGRIAGLEAGRKELRHDAVKFRECGLGCAVVGFFHDS